MFYHLLYPLSENIGLFNLFQYITFRSGAAFITALVIVLWSGEFFIQKIGALQNGGQPIRSDGPQSHLAKVGTPTMGGILILGAITIASMLWCNFSSDYVIIALLMTLGFGLIGFIDDYQKVVKKNTKGLSGKVRLFCGALLSIIAGMWVYNIAPINLQGVVLLPFSIDFFIPLGVFFFIFVVFVIVGTANAVNLTDGLDGLATGPVFIASGAFAIIAYISGHVEFSNYLHLSYIPNSGELTVFLFAIMGACLGFLWFNAPPAMIFMGDTGSLALGAALGSVAVITRHEVVLIVIGGIFVAETVSVILQVASFKLRGKRIFRMAPLHHHFEKKGWPETRVVMRFWIISIVLALVGLATVKLR